MLRIDDDDDDDDKEAAKTIRSLLSLCSNKRFLSSADFLRGHCQLRLAPSSSARKSGTGTAVESSSKRLSLSLSSFQAGVVLSQNERRFASLPRAPHLLPDAQRPRLPGRGGEEIKREREKRRRREARRRDCPSKPFSGPPPPARFRSTHPLRRPPLPQKTTTKKTPPGRPRRHARLVPRNARRRPSRGRPDHFGPQTGRPHRPDLRVLPRGAESGAEEFFVFLFSFFLSLRSSPLFRRLRRACCAFTAVRMESELEYRNGKRERNQRERKEKKTPFFFSILEKRPKNSLFSFPPCFLPLPLKNKTKKTPF